MSVQTQIDRISGNVSAALSAIAEKGVTVPDGSTSDALAELIASIQAGGGGIIFSTGIFTPAEDATSCTIQHGLGVVPDIVAYWTQEATTLAYTMIFGVNAVRGIMDASGNKGAQPPASAAQYTTSEVGAYFWAPNSTYESQKLYLNESPRTGNTAPYCAPNSANATTFQIGYGEDYYVRSAISYRWIAISGVK